MLEVLEAPETCDSPLPPPRFLSAKSIVNPVVYGLTIFLSAALLFQVQLIFAKYILPFFGGVPSVWNACMFCFQMLLLFGYGYSHLLKTRFSIRVQRAVHCTLLLGSAVLLAILWFRWGTPLTPGPAWRPGPSDNPVARILEMLAVSVAFPFFMVSTTGPLLQSWAAKTNILSSPYRLYALSNAGSLLGLLTYPFVVEWAFTIRHQAWLWSSGYLLFVGMSVVIALGLPKKSADTTVSPICENSASRPKAMNYILWIAFSTCSTVILLSATNFICENIAAIPLLWVLPLAIYLLTFMIAFERDRWYSRKTFWPLYALAVGLVLNPGFDAKAHPLIIIGLHCLTIFAVCMVCHGELASSKPSTDHLTSFYWIVAAGGALGGTFVILIAPLLFRAYWEFQGALLACGVLLFASFLLNQRSTPQDASAWSPVAVILLASLPPQFVPFLPPTARVSFLRHEYWTVPIGLLIWLLLRVVFHGAKSTSSLPGKVKTAAVREPSRPSPLRVPWQPFAAFLSIALFALLLYAYATAADSRFVYRDRNFFGTKYVSSTPDGLYFVSGNTIHGMQLKDPANHYMPTFYYSPQSGIGKLLLTYPRKAENGPMRIGVIGLGVGSLASYSQPGDYLRFYEIDPAVISMSVGPNPYFSLLQHARGRVDIVLGDARLSLERELTQSQLQKFDVLVIDAFNSDSIPTHLLTRESAALYLRHLRGQDSVLAFNVSNRYLDLSLVLRGLAALENLAIVQVVGDGSRWILLARNPSMLQASGLRDVAGPPSQSRPPVLWTDDYSNVFQVFRSASLVH